MRLLICIESFLPGHAGGGPVRSVANLFTQLGGEAECRVLTRNHDYLQSTPYPDLPVNRWTACPGGEILYATDEDWFDAFEHTLREWSPDWIYLNGLFAPMTRRILAARHLPAPVLLAPHGNLGAGAMRHATLKKRAWMLLAKARGRLRGVRWHAGSPREAGQIRLHFGTGADIRIIPMPPGPTPRDLPALQAEPNRLRLVYFGRFAPEKNLPFAGDLLETFARERPGLEIHYDLFGSGESAAREKQSSPPNLKVSCHPSIPGDVLREELLHGGYAAMLMPSLSENFSYTILEAMQAGIPPLVSDQTPWRDLEPKGIGWDLPLDAPERWLAALRELADASAEARESRRQRVHAHAREWTANYQAQAKALFTN